MKKLLALLLGALLVLSVGAVAEEGHTVAYLSASTTTPFWNWVETGITDACAERGWELIVYNSAEDSATQLKNTQNAITRGVDAIIISPVDSASCPAVLDEAESYGIPVVICDIGTEEGTYLSFIMTPNYNGSYEVGAYLGQYLKDNGLSGTICMIDVPLSRINGQLRYEGFATALKEYGFSVDQVLESETFTLDEADGQARNLITAHSDIVAIYAAHSQATSVAGAIAGVVRDRGRAELQAIGAGAVNQATKAVAIARGYLALDGIDVVCVPTFAVVEIGDQERTAIRFIVEPR